MDFNRQKVQPTAAIPRRYLLFVLVVLVVLRLLVPVRKGLVNAKVMVIVPGRQNVFSICEFVFNVIKSIKSIIA